MSPPSAISSTRPRVPLPPPSPSATTSSELRPPRRQHHGRPPEKYTPPATGPLRKLLRRPVTEGSMLESTLDTARAVAPQSSGLWRTSRAAPPWLRGERMANPAGPFWPAACQVCVRKEDLMEETRFDELTRTLGQRPSRRGVLTAVAAGVAMLVGVGQTAEARRRRVRKQARGNKGPDACAVRCADQPKARGAQCRQICRSCEAGPAGTCLNYETGAFTCSDTDPRNCGSCGHICPDSTPVCADGACCVAFGEDCGGDPDHPCCGAGNYCGDFNTCVACVPENGGCFVRNCCAGLTCLPVGGTDPGNYICVPQT